MRVYLNLIYGISCWGGIPNSKLGGLFRIQKRCVRLLFGLEYSFDHAGYYETCARVRSYQENKSKKNYCLEHTKPIFNKEKILSIFNLYFYHTFLNIFKIQKTRVPISLFSILNQDQRDTNFLLCLPLIKRDISKNNFIFKSISIWNRLVNEIFEKSPPNNNGIVIKGSAQNSDLCATVPLVKNKLKSYLFVQQSLGDNVEWLPEITLAI